MIATTVAPHLRKRHNHELRGAVARCWGSGRFVINTDIGLRWKISYQGLGSGRKEAVAFLSMTKTNASLVDSETNAAKACTASSPKFRRSQHDAPGMFW